MVAEKGKAEVDATTGLLKAGFKGMQFINFAAMTSSGEDGIDVWTIADQSNKNEVSDLTVDATNKNERFSNSSVMWGTVTDGVPASSLRLSQAFILQTADNKYKNIPKA